MAIARIDISGATSFKPYKGECSNKKRLADLAKTDVFQTL